jgi:hypothetical protein
MGPIVLEAIAAGPGAYLLRMSRRFLATSSD